VQKSTLVHESVWSRFQIYNPTFARGAPFSAITSALFAPLRNQENVESKYRCWIIVAVLPAVPVFQPRTVRFIGKLGSRRWIRCPKIEKMLFDTRNLCIYMHKKKINSSIIKISAYILYPGECFIYRNIKVLKYESVTIYRA